jgi:hypothetical protein
MNENIIIRISGKIRLTMENAKKIQDQTKETERATLASG